MGMIGCGFVWGMYGILSNDMTIMAPNLIGVVSGAYYMYHFINNCPPTFKTKPHILGVTALTLWTTGCALMMDKATALHLLGLTGDAVVIALFGGPLVAIKSILKDKSTKNLPFEFTMIAFLNTAFWTGYGTLVIHDPYVWIPNGIGLCFTTLQMSFFLRFGIENAPLLGISEPVTAPQKPPKKKKIL